MKTLNEQDPPSRPTLQRGRRGGITSRLQVDEMNYAIPLNQDAQQHVEEVHGKESWRYKTLKFIHKPSVQRTLLGLLILDVLLLFVEMFLLASFPECSIIERDGISCCPGNETEHLRWLGEDHSEEFCDKGLVASFEYEAGCDPHKWHAVHVTEDVLFALTIVILSIMFIELNMAMIALTPGVFFRQFFYLMDYFIIAASLALELTFHFLSKNTASSLAGLLVVLRMWRFVRVTHGIMSVTAELEGEKLSTLLNYCDDLEELLKYNDIDMPAESESVRKIRHGEDETSEKIRKEHHLKSHKRKEVPEEKRKDVPDLSP